MGIIVTNRERIKQLEREKLELQEENNQLRAALEYVAVCSYPELLEDEEEEANE